VIAGCLDVLRAFHQAARSAIPDFAIASETHWDRAFPYVDASYARYFGADHLPTVDYTFPEFRATCCVTGPADFGLVNNCLRYRHIINLEPRCLHASTVDVPHLARYVAEVLRLRRELRGVLWDSRIVEPREVERAGDGGMRCGVLHSLLGEGKAAVLHHFEERALRTRVSIPGAAQSSATLYQPFRAPREVRLPFDLTLEADEVGVLVFR